MRLRKLIGVSVFVAGSLAYFAFVISVAFARLPGTSLGFQLLCYLIVTLIWMAFAGLLIRWMLRPRPGDTVAV